MVASLNLSEYTCFQPLRQGNKICCTTERRCSFPPFAKKDVTVSSLIPPVMTITAAEHAEESAAVRLPRLKSAGMSTSSLKRWEPSDCSYRSTGRTNWRSTTAVNFSRVGGAASTQSGPISAAASSAPTREANHAENTNVPLPHFRGNGTFVTGTSRLVTL